MIENEVIHKFKRTFMKETYPIVADTNLAAMAMDKSIANGTEYEDEKTKLDKEFAMLGEPLFSFSEGTSPAVKQMRRAMLLAGCGAINLEIDEIGSNLINNTDIINTYLEMYDVGRVKEKLIKNTAENKRGADLDGITPANMMLFGTPDKLFDGGTTQDNFMSFLETGYARRLLVGYIEDASKNMSDMTPEEILAKRMDKSNDTLFESISNRLAKLAEPQHHNKIISVEKDVALELIEYEILCANRVDEMPSRNGILRAEMTHRYFKSLKIAGAFAFVDGSSIITMDHLHSAIKLVEESGVALKKLLNVDKPHVKLAKYLADQESEVTHAELVDDLPTFKGNVSAKNDMISLAGAWGYKNNIVVKKSYVNGIELLSADSLKETNLDKLIMSVGTDVAYGYNNGLVSWDELGSYMQEDGFHWCVHHLNNGHRKDSNIIEGFNLLVLDVDDGISIETARSLLKGYKCLIYTTKRHTEEHNRFRIVFPMNYELKLNTEDYKAFMRNVYDWLPFEVDDATSDRPRKWMTNKDYFEYMDGEVLDIVPFIPNTTKAEELAKVKLDNESLNNLERWFMQKTGKGNRSNQLIKYALMLVDAGKNIDEVGGYVKELNEKLKDKLDESEIETTIMRSVRNKLNK